jgi:MOSC domain-containing protein
MVRIESLHVYPVKSCAGIALERASVGAAGLQHDREWVIVDEQDHFLTQRDVPRLALIRTTLETGHLRLDAPGLEPLRVGLDHRGEPRNVTVWRSRNPSFDAGDAAAAWVGGFLGRPVRLVRFDAAHRRLSNRDWTGEIEALNFFSDGYPVLVLSRGSLDDLNGRLGRTLDMNRFRPNVVIDGVEPYAEDRIREIHAGDVVLRLVKPSTRCVITTTDQATGERDGDEPLRTLKTYRFSSALRGIAFGVNAVIVRGQGADLQRHQPVEVRLR